MFLEQLKLFLPKIHKPDMPLRPILSSIGSFSYDCAKWLSDSLSELRHHETCVKDTLTFLSLLQDRSSSGKIMTSFDVTSLFTNVPVDFTIKIIFIPNFSRLEYDNFFPYFSWLQRNPEHSYYLRPTSTHATTCCLQEVLQLYTLIMHADESHNHGHHRNNS